MFYEFNCNNFQTAGELANKVSEVHKQLFPNATLKTQCAKFEEEYEEYKQAQGIEALEELADLFIVACGIYNFNKAIGTLIYSNIVKKLQTDLEAFKAFKEAVCEKMNKNQKRVWAEIETGYYKHESNNIN